MTTKRNERLCIATSHADYPKKENKLMIGKLIAYFYQFIDQEAYTSGAPRGTTLEFEKKLSSIFQRVYTSVIGSGLKRQNLLLRRGVRLDERRTRIRIV